MVNKGLLNLTKTYLLSDTNVKKAFLCVRWCLSVCRMIYDLPNGHLTLEQRRNFVWNNVTT